MSNASKDSQLQPPPANLLVDLSDTVTMPSRAMRLAMQDAPLGDDVFGEDESIQALQRRCAALTGHEAALFCPSGTMTNQIAIQVHTRPGDEVICDKLSHIYNYEGGGIARNSGASVRLLHGHRGRYSVDDMLANVNLNSHYALMVCGRHVQQGRRIGLGCGWCRLSSLQGARAQIPPRRRPCVEPWVRRGEWGHASALQLWPHVRHVAVFEQGPELPRGLRTRGVQSFIQEAHRSRKVMGGGMRQAGMLAAAGLPALDHHVARLRRTTCTRPCESALKGPRRRRGRRRNQHRHLHTAPDLANDVVAAFLKWNRMLCGWVQQSAIGHTST